MNGRGIIQGSAKTIGLVLYTAALSALAGTYILVKTQPEATLRDEGKTVPPWAITGAGAGFLLAVTALVADRRDKKKAALEATRPTVKKDAAKANDPAVS